MSVWSTSIRIVLSLALVLNGIGGAAAATRMQLAQHAMAGHGANHQMAGTTAPCHEGMVGMTGMHAPADVGGAVKDHQTPHKTPDTPDCCKGGACSCACMSMAQAVAIQPTISAMLWGSVSSVRSLPLGHADPALPHLIRPPIG